MSDLEVFVRTKKDIQRAFRELKKYRIIEHRVWSIEFIFSEEHSLELLYANGRIFLLEHYRTICIRKRELKPIDLFYAIMVIESERFKKRCLEAKQKLYKNYAYIL